MTNYTQNTAVTAALVANTSDTVIINSTAKQKLRVVNETGTSPISVTVGSITQSLAPGPHDVEVPATAITGPSAPTVGGANDFEVPAEPGAEIVLDVGPVGAIISLISAGAMTYTVETLDGEEESIP